MPVEVHRDSPKVSSWLKVVVHCPAFRDLPLLDDAAIRFFHESLGTASLLARHEALDYYPSMKTLHTLFFAFLAASAIAAETPYDEKANAKSDIKQALTQDAKTKTPVIVVFGANWCGDCKMLDSAMKKGASASLLSRDFKIVKVDVGRFDKNVDVAESYAVPLKKGIPAVAILSSKGDVLYVTKDGELADARKMGDSGIYEFFKRVTESTKAK